jgi:5-methylcytosine-specific restriction endonuclease McrA
MNRHFTAFDIKWIKNVSNTDVGSAYMDMVDNDILRFPTNHKGNVMSPRIGEIILLHQNIKGQKVFTHLVTPTDTKIDENGSEQYKFGRKVKVIAKTPIDKLIPVYTTLWNIVNFQGISQGNACEIAEISSVNGYDILLQDIWDKFSPFFQNDHLRDLLTTQNLNNEISNTDPELTVTEGKLRLITHYVRERDRNIVKEKKRLALQEKHLKCEICTFSFIENYGVKFIECHHKTPIFQSGITETTLDKLILVCSNCHRMLHKKVNGHFLTIENLKKKFERTNR